MAVIEILQNLKIELFRLASLYVFLRDANYFGLPKLDIEKAIAAVEQSIDLLIERIPDVPGKIELEGTISEIKRFFVLPFETEELLISSLGRFEAIIHDLYNEIAILKG